MLSKFRIKMPENTKYACGFRCVEIVSISKFDTNARCLVLSRFRVESKLKGNRNESYLDRIAIRKPESQ